MRYIGVDPGVSGGLACIDNGEAHAWPVKPLTEMEIWSLLARLECNGVFAVLEKTHGGPKMRSSAAFTFGRSAGLLHMAIVAAGIPFDIVTPQRWQATMGVRTSGKKYGDYEKKKLNRQRAQQLFPELKVTNATADALLLAEYCRRTRTGTDK